MFEILFSLYNRFCNISIFVVRTWVYVSLFLKQDLVIKYEETSIENLKSKIYI